MTLILWSCTDNDFFKLSKDFVLTSIKQKITTNLYIHLSEILMQNENNVANKGRCKCSGHCRTLLKRVIGHDKYTVGSGDLGSYL